MNKDRRKRIEEIKETLEAAVSDLEAVRDEEQEAFDNMPQGFQDSEKGEKMVESIGLLDEAVSSLEDLSEVEVGADVRPGPVSLVLRFPSMKDLIAFVEEHLPSRVSVYAADGIDRQKLVEPLYVVANRNEAREGKVDLEAQSPKEVADAMAGAVSEASNNLDSVQ